MTFMIDIDIDRATCLFYTTVRYYRYR